MVAIDSRSLSASPFSATARAVEQNGEGELVPAVVETASPSGGVVRLPGSFRTGDRLVLSVRAKHYNLLDVVAEIVNVEETENGACRAGVAFLTELPKRQFVFIRRVADRITADKL